jgi:hypothetical protein
VAVLARALGQTDAVVVYEHVVVGGRDIDLAALQLLAVARECRRQRSLPAQDVGQHAGPRGRHVQDDEHGRGELARQVGDQLLEGVDTARGGSDHHEIAVSVGELGLAGLRRFNGRSLRPIGRSGVSP